MDAGHLHVLPLERLRSQGELDPAIGDLDDLGAPLPFEGDELPSSVLARLRHDALRIQLSL